MIQVTKDVSIPDAEVEIQAIRASGPGGQNVNKVASGIHLFFDVGASSLPETVKQGLLALSDRRITRDGVVVIKAVRHRTQEQNRDDAMSRLREFILEAMVERAPRRPTRPPRSAAKKRLETKSRVGRLKKWRRAVDSED
ncbi:MAG: aminoacyl-tRNA hydrolase [Deltaproteobacteria bacterium]|nr:aminoacyl-tRNA hydrolase [Deltaproteobacteria bacterium]